MIEDKYTIELMCRAYLFSMQSVNEGKAWRLTSQSRKDVVRQWIAKVGTGLVRFGSRLERLAIREDPIPAGAEGIHSLRIAG